MRNKLVTLLLSFVIAFALWVYVITVVSPNSEVTISDIKVTLLNEDDLRGRGFIVTNKNELTEVALSMLGNRADLIQLNNTNIPVTLDVGDIDGAGEYRLSYSVDLPGVSIEDRNPDEILVKVDVLAKNSVDVKVTFTSDVDSGYQRLEETLDHGQVEIEGPLSIVEQIATAEVTVDLSGRKSDINESFKYVLLDRNGEQINMRENLLTPNVNEIKVMAKVVPVKDVSFTTNVKCPEWLNPENLELTVFPEKITVTGQQEILDTLSSKISLDVDLKKYFNSEVDLFNGEIKDHFELVVPYELSEGVENLSQNTNEVRIKVVLTGYSAKVFEFSEGDIEFYGQPVELVRKPTEDKFQIVVIGKTEMIEEITESDILLSVDLSTATTEQKAFTVNVELDEAFSDVYYDLKQDKYSFTFTARAERKV